MKDFNLRRSAIWSVAEVVTSSIALFFLYKYIVAVLGLRSLGIWSLVLATTSLARLGDVGAAAGLSRFVAKAFAENNLAKATRFVETAFYTNLGIYTVITFGLVYPLWIGISSLVPPDTLPEARSLLPFALLSFGLQNVNAVLFSGLIGTQRMDLKSKIGIFGVVIQLIIAVALVPSFGLLGMGLSQIMQYLFSMIASWICLRKVVGDAVVPWVPRHFSQAMFHQLFGFGIKLQFASLISFCFEPVIKFLMSAAYGLEALAIFEMAYRLVLQARHLVVSPMQALLPAFAQLSHEHPHELASLYEKSTTKSLLLATPVLLTVGVSAPIVSLFWLGTYNGIFVAFAALLSLGWLANALGTPAYHLGVARGILRWNILGHVVTSIGGPLLGYLFGHLLGPIGFVSCVSAGLAFGAATSMMLNCREALIRAWPSPSAVMKGLKAELRAVAAVVQRQLKFLET